MKSRVLKRAVKRDQKLIKDYQDDMPMVRLVGKYQISSTRIYQILRHYKVPMARKLG